LDSSFYRMENSIQILAFHRISNYKYELHVFLIRLVLYSEAFEYISYFAMNPVSFIVLSQLIVLTILTIFIRTYNLQMEQCTNHSYQLCNITQSSMSCSNTVQKKHLVGNSHKPTKHIDIRYKLFLISIQYWDWLTRISRFWDTLYQLIFYVSHYSIQKFK
jgi:hypothetical protein